MGKRLILVLALALVVGLTFSAAYAEVQNVKVSGDIIASGVVRNHFNLQNGPAGDKDDIQQSFFMTQAWVRIDADLTDNVSATVRLINERVWGNNRSNGSDTFDSNGRITSNSIELDLAYVTLKEFLYSPLTLTVGRQEIKFGNGLIIGKSAPGFAYLPVAQIPSDLSERRAFDAIRATLNYDPLVVDLMYAKVEQPVTYRNNTVELLGVNATYAINKKIDVAAYYFLKSDNNDNLTDSKGKADKVNTIGTLLSIRPIDNLVTSLEAAYQFGKNDQDHVTAWDTGSDASRHNAWAVQAIADYTFAKMKMTPKIGGSYTYLSGGKNTGAGRNNGWDSMFYDQALNNITYAILPFNNLSVFNLKGSIKPMEDVTLMLNYGYYDRASGASGRYIASPATYDAGQRYIYDENVSGEMYDVVYTGKQHLGDAIDATIIYDYTEDVQIGLTAGWFKSGRGLASTTNSSGDGTGRRDATQLIGSMKVTF
jgi:hypothetical protein